MAAALPTDELGGSFFDYDNDTDLDLFMANGHIYPQVGTHLEYGELYTARSTIPERYSSA